MFIGSLFTLFDAQQKTSAIYRMHGNFHPSDRLPARALPVVIELLNLASSNQRMTLEAYLHLINYALKGASHLPKEKVVELLGPLLEKLGLEDSDLNREKGVKLFDVFFDLASVGGVWLRQGEYYLKWEVHPSHSWCMDWKEDSQESHVGWRNRKSLTRRRMGFSRQLVR